MLVFRFTHDIAALAGPKESDKYEIASLVYNPSESEFILILAELSFGHQQFTCESRPRSPRTPTTGGDPSTQGLYPAIRSRSPGPITPPASIDTHGTHRPPTQPGRHPPTAPAPR